MSCLRYEYVDERLRSFAVNRITRPYYSSLNLSISLSSEQKLTLTDVVPIAGLTMARFHIAESELTTVIDMWDSDAHQGKRKASLVDCRIETQ